MRYMQRPPHIVMLGSKTRFGMPCTQVPGRNRPPEVERWLAELVLLAFGSGAASRSYLVFSVTRLGRNIFALKA